MASPTTPDASSSSPRAAEPATTSDPPSASPPAPFTGNDADVLRAAARWKEEGRGVALATVVGTWGSAPRGVGSQMAVSDRREMVGSVSGGCVEGAVVEEAQDVLSGGPPRLLEFGVSDDEAWSVGLACGGSVRIWLEAVG